MADNKISTMKISKEFKSWLATHIEEKGESYEDIVRRLTGYPPREATVGVTQG